MKCNKCYHILPKDSEFCQYCGNKITGVTISEIIEDDSVDIENISDEDALNVLTAAQLKSTKEAYDANIPSRPNNEGDFDFGLIPEKPIYTLARKSVEGEIEYLSKLRTPNGEKVKGFGVQKTHSVKKTKKSKLDIVNIFVLILPLILSIAGIDISYYIHTEEMFASILVVGIIAIVLKIFAVVKFKNSIIISAVVSCSFITMLICSLATEDEDIGLWICVFTLYLFSCELYRLIKISIEKYHSTQSYKMKCYKKINQLNEYREKGVITEAEYEETRNQIISKIQ